MSKNYSLVCHATKTHIWIGHGPNESDKMTTFYSGVPSAMDSLGQFLIDNQGEVFEILADSICDNKYFDYQEYNRSGPCDEDLTEEKEENFEVLRVDFIIDRKSNPEYIINNLVVSFITKQEDVVSIHHGYIDLENGIKVNFNLRDLNGYLILRDVPKWSNMFHKNEPFSLDSGFLQNINLLATKLEVFNTKVNQFE